MIMIVLLETRDGWKFLFLMRLCKKVQTHS